MITRNMPVIVEEGSLFEEVKKIQFKGMCFFLKLDNGKEVKYRFEHVSG